MRIETVAKFADDLCQYYGKPLPTDRTVELWHAALTDLPDGSAPGIFEQIIREYDCMPQNIPKTMKDIHFKRGKYQEYGPVYREVTFDD